MKIQILGTGCSRCTTLFARTEEALAALRIPAEIEKIEDLRQIAEFGVVSTPALVVDGKVQLAGRVASVEEIKALIAKR